MKEKMQTIWRHNKVMIVALASVLFVTLLIISGLVTHNIYQEKLRNAQEKPPVILDHGVFGDDIIKYGSDQLNIIGNDAEDVIMLKTTKDPNAIWDSEQDTGNFTTVEKATMKNGSIGVLTIQKIGLSVNVYESPDTLEAMEKGVAHFPSTTAWDGNIGLSAHNLTRSGKAQYFENLHKLKVGDEITYQTALGERTYVVTAVTTIEQANWEPLSYADENQLTMITCITGKPTMRLCVQAVEKAE